MKYITDLLRKTKMADAKPVSTLSNRTDGAIFRSYHYTINKKP